jgi:hypothetical protein
MYSLRSINRLVFFIAAVSASRGGPGGGTHGGGGESGSEDPPPATTSTTATVTSISTTTITPPPPLTPSSTSPGSSPAPPSSPTSTSLSPSSSASTSAPASQSSTPTLSSASSSQSAASTGPPTSPSSSPVGFLPATNATTCEDAVFRWTSSTSSTLSLSLSISSSSSHATVGLASNISSTSGQYSWQPVNVPAGQYIASLSNSQTMQAYSTSSPFFVLAGNDTSCITSTPSQTTGALSTASVGQLSKGALAGTITGVVVVLLTVISCFTFPSFWARFAPRRRRESSNPPPPPYRSLYQTY